MVDLDVRAVYQARRLSRIVAIDANVICVAGDSTPASRARSRTAKQKNLRVHNIRSAMLSDDSGRGAAVQLSI
jgi:hypothetical protein